MSKYAIYRMFDGCDAPHNVEFCGHLVGSRIWTGDDLIEPEEEDTCCDVSDYENIFTCSRCGCSVRLRSAKADAFENVTYGPTLTMPNGRGGELSFCPHCGARVVSGNGE